MDRKTLDRKALDRKTLDRKTLDRILTSAGKPLAAAHALTTARSEAEEGLAAAVAAVREREVHERLAGLPLESLRGSLQGRVAWTALFDAGLRTLADVESLSTTELLLLDGVGPQSARLVKDAVGEIAAALRSATAPVLDHTSVGAPDADLLVAVVALDDVLRATRSAEPDTRKLLGEAAAAFASAARLRSPLRWMFASRRSRAAAAEAASHLESLIAQHGEAVERAAKVLPTMRDVRSARIAYIDEPARYQAVLDSRAPVRQSGTPGLPQEVADAIAAFTLDVSALRVVLRRYQEFGAKFILSQRRVILGDDMGLGKTIQALAALAHLSKEHEGFRALVIAPASVQVNWHREIATKSDLIPVEQEVWSTSGGVLITTFERLKNLTISTDSHIHLLVVDEAHYIKNPEALRTQRVKQLLPRAHRVLFMTGTAIENRGAEFVELVRMVDAGVAARLVGPVALVSPSEFREQVAPVYLRRNVYEVLSELPEVIEMDWWEPMTAHDFEHYRRAVAEGNLMAMRRAGFQAGRMRRSAKLDRLRQIVDEATQSGQKVIVYSFFLNVLAIVKSALSQPTFGPITGSVTPAGRQAIVDAFTAAPGCAVLISQITAGGIGLNIQAASVIVLCEPQFKPSSEYQAIARARRMGQLRAVQVHRLLNPDSIDERVLDMLLAKVTEFDNYARHSDLALASDQAVDARVALRLVSDERARLGILT